jgi:hypothetical protein
MQMKATAYFSDGSRQDVTSETSWQSSNPTAATITSAGVLSLLSKGVTTITATYQGKSSSRGISVFPVNCAEQPDAGGC